MPSSSSTPLVLGKFGAPYGVRGFIKVYSYTEPTDNLMNYPNWYVKYKGQWQTLAVDSVKKHGAILIAKIKNIDSPEDVHKYTNSLIGVMQAELPELAPGEYYWAQLEGLTVKNAQGKVLGVIDHLLETEGANDVMVVRNQDGVEHLIPYLKSILLNIDLKSGEMQVDWDPDAED
jgi:16S rRNA processing protein RimM